MKNIHNLKLFTILGIFIVAIGWLSLLLTFSGFFYSSILAIFCIMGLGYLIYLIKSNKHNLKFDRDLMIVISVSILLMTILSCFVTPSIFSGRDQGAISNAAISLSKNHKLEQSFPAEKEFFEIYGTGVALNFPGFSYNENGNLVPHFPLGYISWIATFYSFFGMFGFIFANALTLLLFLVSFYLISRVYLKPSFALATFFLALTSFVFSWFFKYTLSENLTLGVIWFGIFQFLYFIKEKKQLNLIAFILSFGLLLFIRIEAIAFLVIAGIILFIEYKKEKDFKKVLFKKEIIALFLIILILFGINFKINSAFYINVAKGILNSFTPNGDSSYSLFSPFQKFFYILRALSAYAILNYLIIGFLSFIYFFKNKKNIFIAISYLILLPSFIYVINPSITLDHPWFLRRYMFAVVPVSILYTAFFLKDFCDKRKNLFHVLSLFLLLTNLMISLPFIAVEENKKLLSQIEELSSSFGNNDLILIDRSATSDPWSMMTGPMNLLFEKQAVYFFNPDDLKKIDLEKFNDIYLIVPDFNIEFWKNTWLDEKLVFVKNYEFENVSLNIVTTDKEILFKNPINLPQYQKNYTYGKIYLIKK